MNKYDALVLGMRTSVEEGRRAVTQFVSEGNGEDALEMAKFLSGISTAVVYAGVSLEVAGHCTLREFMEEVGLPEGVVAATMHNLHPATGENVIERIRARFINDEPVAS